MKIYCFVAVGVLLLSGCGGAHGQQGDAGVDELTVDVDLGASREGSRTDAEAVLREEEAISPDGLSVAQQRELRDRAQNFTFQTEVNRMMKLIINSLYRNKEIFLRELISNGSDALDKIRLLSLTDSDALAANPELGIRIKADPERRLLHVIDSGVGMTRADLVNNLGTIAKSGTADFLSKMQDSEKASGAQEMNDMIGQFGVGFYSAFLVADRVTVVSKHNDDAQHVWESDANSFSVAEDPRGDTLKRGTHITYVAEPFYSAFLVADRVTVVSEHNDDAQHVWESDANSFSVAADPRGDTLKRGTHITYVAEPFYSAFLVADRVTVVSEHNDDAQHVWESDANSFSVAADPRGDTLKRGTHITYVAEPIYSAFLVADRVTVVSEHNDDAQHVWESDANSFSVAADPRGDTLKRGTHITLHLKEEAADYLQPDTIRALVKKYSQFINFPIYLWASRTETVEEADADADDDADADAGADDDAKVEDAAEDAKPAERTEKTVWEWQVMNDNKPLWTRKPADVSADEYAQFYKSLTKDSAAPLAHAHFVAEGEVTFRALLFVPRAQPADSFNRYGAKTDHIKLYVRRVFITDEFNDLMPNYLAFVQGIVDSDDLPLNVSRETLQQHKLIKIIKKKLVRKALDMLKKIPDADYEHFWREYSTNVKLGVIEDPSNRSRLAKLLRFQSSRGAELTFLADYVARMKPKQTHIYYIAGASRAEVERSPFAERLVRSGYEVLYLTEAVDEYCLSALPEYDGKKFQNIAKEIFDLDESEEQRARLEAQRAEFEPLTKWLGGVLGEWVTRAAVSRRLARSPAALAATPFGWTGNMERLALSNAHQKADDAQRRHQLAQKKLLEINPRHPVVRELLRRVRDDPDDPLARDAARALYRTAALRSGFLLQEGEAAAFAESVEAMLQRALGLPPDAAPELDDEPADEPDDEPDAPEPGDERHEEL